jgi:hypothetical protein
VDSDVFMVGGGHGACSPLLLAAWAAWVRRPKVLVKVKPLSLDLFVPL